MQDRRISASQVQQAMADDFKRLAEEVAKAMNAARDGHIIADTEELVRQAHAVFREQLYAKAIDLLQRQQEAGRQRSYQAYQEETDGRGQPQASQDAQLPVGVFVRYALQLHQGPKTQAVKGVIVCIKPNIPGPFLDRQRIWIMGGWDYLGPEILQSWTILERILHEFSGFDDFRIGAIGFHRYGSMQIGS